MSISKSWILEYLIECENHWNTSLEFFQTEQQTYTEDFSWAYWLECKHIIFNLKRVIIDHIYRLIEHTAHKLPGTLSP